jgi:ribose transport system substrate-binding protein
MKMAVAPLIVVGVLALGGCSSGGAEAGPSGTSAATQSEGVAGKKVTILAVSQTCEYCAIATDAAQKVLEDAGVDVTVQITEFDAAVQAQQVNQAISTKPDAVLVWPADGTAIVPSLARLTQANIPTIVRGYGISPTDDSVYTSITGPDDKTYAEAAAKAMIDGFKEKGFGDTGNIVMIQGVPTDPPSIVRSKAFTDYLAKNAPGIKILGAQPGNWDQTTATSAAAALITQYGSNLQGIYGMVDNMTAGAIVAAERAGLDPTKLTLVGSNCTIEGYQNVENKKQFATFMQSSEDDGKLWANTAVDALSGKKVSKESFMEPKEITSPNLADCAPNVGK